MAVFALVVVVVATDDDEQPAAANRASIVVVFGVIVLWSLGFLLRFSFGSLYELKLEGAAFSYIGYMCTHYLLLSTARKILPQTLSSLV